MLLPTSTGESWIFSDPPPDVGGYAVVVAFKSAAF
jgi:hypothetical protein